MSKHLPQVAQVAGGIMAAGGFGVMLGWAIGCVICGVGLLAVGTLAERAKMTRKA